MSSSGTRVHADYQSSLDKFLLLSCCGDGVPESRKGLFRMSPLYLTVIRDVHPDH